MLSEMEEMQSSIPYIVLNLNDLNSATKRHYYKFKNNIQRYVLPRNVLNVLNKFENIVRQLSKQILEYWLC
jgi:hypothetical protein